MDIVMEAERMAIVLVGDVLLTLQDFNHVNNRSHEIYSLVRAAN